MGIDGKLGYFVPNLIAEKINLIRQANTLSFLSRCSFLGSTLKEDKVTIAVLTSSVPRETDH